MNALKNLFETYKEDVIDTARFLGGVAAIWFGLVTFIFAPFHIPSESMQPSLEVGDRVLVSKWAYGYSRHSLPLGLGYAMPDSWNGRLAWHDPQRGDVVVFRDERQASGRPANLIKRVIGVAGDTLEVREGRLFINGVTVPRVFEDIRNYRPHGSGSIQTVTHYTETLPNDREHAIYERSDDYRHDTYGPVTIPPGTVFVMGDNRDASNDSRVPGGPGLVPLANVVGRAETVIFTFARCRREEGLYCPSGRVWQGL